MGQSAMHDCFQKLGAVSLGSVMCSTSMAVVVNSGCDIERQHKTCNVLYHMVAKYLTTDSPHTAVKVCQKEFHSSAFL